MVVAGIPVKIKVRKIKNGEDLLISETGLRIASINGKFNELAQKRLDNLTKPLGSLGRLEEFAEACGNNRKHDACYR